MPPKKIIYPTFIPVEIWRESWRRCRRRELRALTRTCRLFHEICLPLLFAHVTQTYVLRDEAGWEAWSSLELLLSRRIQKIAASPKYASLVRQWDISIMPPGHVFQFSQLAPDLITDGFQLVVLSRQSLNHTVCQSLPAFTGLRTLQLMNLDFGEDISNALKALPSLQNLFCKWTAFSCYPAPLLPLRKFRLDSCEEEFPPDGAPFDIVSRNSLVRLNIGSNIFPWIFTSLSNQGPCENLSDLELDDHFLRSNLNPGLGIFFNFLASCPRLRKLSLRNSSMATVNRVELHDPFGDIFPLPSSIIPQLQSFAGYGYLAKAIIPGHPVEVVSIMGAIWRDFDEVIAILKSISRSTKPVLDLSLPWMRTNPAIISCIYTYFPKLEHLHLGLGVTSEDIVNTELLPSLPSYQCSRYCSEDEDDIEMTTLSQTSLSSLEDIHRYRVVRYFESGEPMSTTEDDAINNLRCSHSEHGPFPYAYVVRIQYDDESDRSY